MGVTQLWQILSPVQEHQSLSSLEGLVLAVDLSIWICESDGVKLMQGVVAKPHLRNLFFRILHLTQIGVKLVFVIEGAAPELKWEVMAKRQQSRFPGRQGKQAPAPKPPTKQARRHFNAILKECCELLDILGMPYIQSKGEAEALCALLNSSGLVDGCLTDDGDVFLYGAQTVYKNFTMNAKDPHVERYRLTDIETHLGIDRSALVGLALLLGCDFVPKGVSGIGMANAMKLLECLHGKNVLERLQEWRKIHESQCIDPIEKMVRRKALNAPDFPQIEVINEFLIPKDKCPSRLSPWKRPVPVKLQEFALAKLDWPVEYTMEKILPLLTLWDMQDVLKSRNPSKHQHLQPHRIVKARIRQGVPCYEIEWFKPVTDPYHEGDYYVTIENQEMFYKCYPTVVKEFLGETNSKNKKKKAKKKKAKDKTNDNNQSAVDNLSFNFGKLNMKSVTHKLQESLHQLHPSFTDYEHTSLTTKVKQSSISQTPNKFTATSTTSEKNQNSNNSARKDLKQSQVLATNQRTEMTEESELPFSERIQLRLKKKKQKQNKDTNVETALHRFENLSLSGSQLSSKRKKRKSKSTQNTENHTDKSNHSPQVNKSIKHMPMNSPMSPFVHGSVSAANNLRNMNARKMSSPASDTFCSPASYYHQLAQDTVGGVFKDSPIQHYTPDPGSRKQKTTMSNFRFFDSPERESSPATTRPTSHTQTEKNVNTEKPCTPSMLKGIWETEYMDNYIHELSKDFSLGPNGTLQYTGNKQSNTNVNQVFLNQSSFTPNGQRQLEKNSSRHEMNQTSQTNQTQEVNFGDFELQSSLLNNLCASLIQTLTPKGMDRDQYESLCESLKKMDNPDGDLKTESVACNIDFAEVEKVSSKLKNPLIKNMRPIDLNESLSRRNSNISSSSGSTLNTDGLGKSARKRLKRKQRNSMQVTSNVENSSKSFKSNSAPKRSDKGLNMNRPSCNTATKPHLNLNFCQDGGTMKQNNITQCSSKGANNSHLCNGVVNIPNMSCKQKQNGGRSFPSDQNPTNGSNSMDTERDISKENKKKRKNRKKKIAKTSAQMDFSLDTSKLNESQYKLCSEYLKKALEDKPSMNPQIQKISKASPIMDLSADDTFLELEVLSSCLDGNNPSINTDVKRKIALKKKLSKRQTKTDTTSKTDDAEGSTPKSPVFSMNADMPVSTEMDKLVELDDGSELVEGKTTCNVTDEDAVLHLMTCHKEDGYDPSKYKEKLLQINIQSLEETKFGLMGNGSPTKGNSVISCISRNKIHDRFDIDYEGWKEDMATQAKPVTVSIKSADMSSVRSDGKTDVDCCKNKVTTTMKHVEMNSPFCERSRCVTSDIQNLTADQVFAEQRKTEETSPRCCRLDSPICERSRFATSSDIQDLTADQVFAEQRKTETSPRCCRLDMGSLSNELHMSDRNIQTCKDLRSWSMLPNRSVTDHQKVKRTGKSAKLHSDSGTCRSHDGSHKKPHKTSRVNKMYCRIFGRPLRNGDNDPHNIGDSEVNTTNHEVNQTGYSKPKIEPDFEIIELEDTDDHRLCPQSTAVEVHAYIGKDNHKVDLLVDQVQSGENGLISDETGVKKEDGSCLNYTAVERDSADHTRVEDMVIKCFENHTEKIEEYHNGYDNEIRLQHDVCVDNSVAGEFSYPTSPMGNGESTKPFIKISNINFYSKDLESSENDVQKVQNEFGLSDAAFDERKVESLNKKDINQLDVYQTANEMSEIQNGNDIQNALEGSSDKENDQVVENGKHSTSLSNGSATNISKEDTVNTVPNSSKMSDGTPVARSASPIPLLDRLKMKFKKSSARSVLHSFTNGR